MPRTVLRRRLRAAALGCLLAALLSACTAGGGGAPGGAGGASASGPLAPTRGAFALLTYNVAGLPAGLSSSRPDVYTRQISPLLNGYDVVLVQEDFWYHQDLASLAAHPYQSPPQRGHVAAMNDGLNLFSVFPFDPLERETWVACHGIQSSGSDCLAAKGFFRATLRPAPGVEIDVYDLHADAGGGANDVAARDAQMRQLEDAIARRSAGRAVIVAGDYNLREGRADDLPILSRFYAAAGADDACRALACGEDRIDRVALRSGARVALRPLSWRVAREFVDASGADLSDHEAIHVVIEWETRP
jgi:hypothetical protein